MFKQIATSIVVLAVFFTGSWYVLNKSEIKVARQGNTFGAITPYQIVQGGTGASSFAKGVLIGMNSAGTAMVATGTPQLTVGNLLATSTGSASSIVYRLGIGTLSPSFKLHVKETNNATYAVTRIENDAGKVLDLGLGPSTAGAPYGNNAYFSTGSTANENMHFFADGTGGSIDFYTGGSAAGNMRLMLATGGNVGVASSTPTYTLSVGSSNTGTFGISTTTNGCAQLTNGLLWSTGSACGSGTGGGIGNPFTNSFISNFLGSLYTSATTSAIRSTSVATSSLGNLNGKYWVPDDYAVNGCAGNPTYTDFGACVNGLYSLASTSGNGHVAIGVPAMKVPSANWTTPINFGINGLGASLQCERGAVLIYGGTATSTLWNGGDPTGHTVSDNYGCTMQGNTTRIAAGQANAKTTVGIGLGGNHGAVGINFRDWDVNGFGQNIHISSNAYMLKFSNMSNSGGNGGVLGSLVYIDVASNSGERNTWEGGSLTDPGNSVEDNCVYISNAATASNFFSQMSIDDCVVRVGSSNGMTSFDQIHFENAAHGTYGRYTLIQGVSSDLSTHISVTNSMVANDTSGANAFDILFTVGGPIKVDGLNIQNYGGGTISAVVDHSLDNGVSGDHICNVTVQGGGLTQLTNGGGGITYSRAAGIGCTTNVDNSYSIGLIPGASNTNSFVSGNVTAGTYDHSGNWTLGVSAVPSTVTIQKNLTVGSSNVGVLTLSTTTAGCLATGATGIVWSSGSACGSGAGGGIGDPFTHPFGWVSATTSSMAIGTSTISNAMSATLTLASSTASQLSLSAGAGLAQWAFRNAGGNLYFATTTVAGTATSSVAALEIQNQATSTLRNTNGFEFSNNFGGMRVIAPKAASGTTTLEFF